MRLKYGDTQILHPVLINMIMDMAARTASTLLATGICSNSVTRALLMWCTDAGRFTFASTKLEKPFLCVLCIKLPKVAATQLDTIFLNRFSQPSWLMGPYKNVITTWNLSKQVIVWIKCLQYLTRKRLNLIWYTLFHVTETSGDSSFLRSILKGPDPHVTCLNYHCMTYNIYLFV